MQGERIAYSVADAWKHGRPLDEKQNTITTDGRIVRSYAHVIGTTDEAGRKIAKDCHVTRTTTKHARAIALVADEVIPCTH